MSKKDFRIELHLDYLYGEPLTKDIKKRFRWFVRLKENKNVLLKNAEKVNWNTLGKFCLNQIDDLIKTTEIPENMDDDDFKWYKRVYSYNIVGLLEYEIFNTMFHYLNKIDKTNTESQKIRIIRQATKDSKSLIKYTIEILKYQVEISAIKWIKDSQVRKIEMKKLEKYADLGKVFYGKKNRKDEMELFNKIEQKYIQAKKDGLRHSYREIAFYIARTELNLIHEKEHKNFYNRFLEFRKKNKLKTTSFTQT